MSEEILNKYENLQSYWDLINAIDSLSSSWSSIPSLGFKLNLISKCSSNQCIFTLSKADITSSAYNKPSFIATSHKE